MKIKFDIKYTQYNQVSFLLQIVRNSIKKKKIIAKQSRFKIFCIGSIKTGTSSLERALKDFDFQMGNQVAAEILSEDWVKKRADRIIRFCDTADAFQDIPFGLPHLYKELDKAFPGSKFILTVRNDEHQWYNSLVRFHTKLFSTDKSKPPTELDLRNAKYRYKGFILDLKRMFWGYPEVGLYDEDYYKQVYLNHIQDIKEYFKNRADDLLVLNVADKDSYQQLAKFLKIKVKKNTKFPWLNKT